MRCYFNRHQIISRSPSHNVLFVYAIADDSQLDRVRVSIYVNDHPKIEKIIDRDRVSSFALDTKGIDRYTINFEALDRRAGYLHTVESFDRN